MAEPTPPARKTSWDLNDPEDLAELTAKIRASGMPEGRRTVTLPEPTFSKKKGP